jgi:MFS family permease
MTLNAAPALRIRWRIFSFLFGFGFLAYIQQKTITVAAAPMMPDLGLSQLDIGYIEQAFVIGYALFQMPGGVLGQRLGARTTFVLIGLLAFVATLVTPIAPAFLSGTALFVALYGAQLVLGLSQGAIFPVSAGVFAKALGIRAGIADHGTQLRVRGDAAPHRVTHVTLRLATGSHLEQLADTRAHRALGLVWPQYTA